MHRTQRCETGFTIPVSRLCPVVCPRVMGPARDRTHAPGSAPLGVAGFALPLGELFIGDKLLHCAFLPPFSIPRVHILAGYGQSFWPSRVDEQLIADLPFHLGSAFSP